MTNPIRPASIALLAALSCAAQSPSEQLQKGIYLQETAGDFDAALQTYRQIVSTAPAQSAAAAQAQYRIAELFLQKGDLNSAATEFNILASRYSDQKALIAKMAGHMHGLQEQATGVIRDGRFRDSGTGLEFALPAAWKLMFNGASSGNGQMVALSDGTPTDYFVWFKAQATAAAQIAQAERAEVPNKAVSMASYHPDFLFRQESIQNRAFGGREALTAVGDYTEGPNKLCAYYVWIFTTKAHVLFAARDIPLADLERAQSHLDQLISTAIVP